MIPSADQIQGWLQDTGDGWTRLPTSSVDGLLWCLRKAEEAEVEVEKLRKQISAIRRQNEHDFWGHCDL